MRWATAALIVAFAAMACSQPQPLITRERAIELATQQVGNNAVLRDASMGPLAQAVAPDDRPLDRPDDLLVWKVVFSLPDGNVVVVIDATNGEVVTVARAP